MRVDPFGNPLHVRMHYKHGSYWYVKDNKWHKIGPDYTTAMQNYAAWIAPSGGMESLVADVYRWFDRRVERGDLTARSRQQYNTVRERISTAFAEFTPSQVKPSHIGAFIDFYFEDSPTQGNLALSVLRTIFTKATRWGLCEFNPAREVERNKIPARDRYLTDEEFLLIRNGVVAWARPVLDMCYLTAQRIGDVLHIKQSDISDDGVYFQQQKSKKRLLVESSPELVELIKEARGQSKIAGIYLFSKSATLPRNYNAVQYHFQNACKAVGVEDARIHDIRAKALTDADAEGMDAQKLAGHASRAMTERYLRMLRTDRVQSPGKVATLRQLLTL